MHDEADYLQRKTVGATAEKEANTLAAKSKLEKLDNGRIRYDLTWDDIEVEAPIGYGGFSQVFKVQLRGVPEKEGEEFALKFLNPSTRLKTKSFKTGAVDLAIEGEILSRLDHENVIKLHGVCAGGPLQAYVETDRGYFLVLDLLEDTLSNKLDKCRMAAVGGSSSHSSRQPSKYMSQTAVLERVSSVAMGVAKGMEYLHSQGVALRDLKPDNVGFDQDGTTKIFDLGFAREEHTIRKTEVAGSLRYMAPEVAMGQGSRLSSDVYSFGVLLWEICTLEKPYKHINSREEFTDSVFVNEWRHTTSGIPSTALRKLIKECWQTDPDRRPTFDKVVKALRVELSLTKTSTAPTKHKGFGSSATLRRTATWTAKKLASNVSFGVLRPNMSRSSLSKGTAETSQSSEGDEHSGGGKNATFQSPSSGMGAMGGMGRGMSSSSAPPRSAAASAGASLLMSSMKRSTGSSSSNRKKNASFGGDGGIPRSSGHGGRAGGMKKSALFEIMEMPGSGNSPATPSKKKAGGMSRAAPSCPHFATMVK